MIYDHHIFLNNYCFFCKTENILDERIGERFNLNYRNFIRWFLVTEICPTACLCLRCYNYFVGLGQLGPMGLGQKNIFECAELFLTHFPISREAWTVSYYCFCKNLPSKRFLCTAIFISL